MNCIIIMKINFTLKHLDPNVNINIGSTYECILLRWTLHLPPTMKMFTMIVYAVAREPADEQPKDVVW